MSYFDVDVRIEVYDMFEAIFEVIERDREREEESEENNHHLNQKYENYKVYNRLLDVKEEEKVFSFKPFQSSHITELSDKTSFSFQFSPVVQGDRSYPREGWTHLEGTSCGITNKHTLNLDSKSKKW